MSTVLIDDVIFDTTAKMLRSILNRENKYYPNVMPLKIGTIENGCRLKTKPVSDRNYLFFQTVFRPSSIWLTAPSSFNLSFQISYDGTNWSNWNKTTSGSTNVFEKINLYVKGDYVFIRATSTNSFSASSSNYMQFHMSGGLVSSGGNIMSLLDSTCTLNSLAGKNYCFYKLFSGCTALTVAPELPVTTLANRCYSAMFSGCTALTAAPELPATTLANYCYSSMFQSCTALTVAPELPATTLVQNCYQNMFNSCTALTVSPELPATTLVSNCYQQMFGGCTNLNYIKVGATSWNTSYTQNWVNNVASTGTFVKPSDTTIATGTSGIPSGWSVQQPVDKNYLCFTANTAGSTISLTSAIMNDVILEYSLNGGPWTTWNKQISNSNYIFDTITLVKKYDCVYLRGNNDYLSSNSYSYCSQFSMTGSISASGNIMSLLDSTCTLNSLASKSWCFCRLFSGCTALTSAPELPATTLTYAHNCYYGMFYGCTALTVAPELPATTLANACYYGMFQGCTALTVAPELPATTLANSCYSSMFMGCTALTVAPELLATTLANYCYEYMFYGCTNLNYIKVGATSWNTSYAQNWVDGVASTGTFVKPTDTTIQTGNNGIPTNWTVVNI